VSGLDVDGAAEGLEVDGVAAGGGFSTLTCSAIFEAALMAAGPISIIPSYTLNTSTINNSNYANRVGRGHHGYVLCVCLSAA